MALYENVETIVIVFQLQSAMCVQVDIQKSIWTRKNILHYLILLPNIKKVLGYLGSHLGRNEDKVKATGLTPVFSDETTYFAELDLVFICRRLYQATLLENGYVGRELIDFNYPNRDFHEVYIGEIVKVRISDDKK